MHSMPAITMHPNKHWLAAQSLDNQILIYGSKDRFRLNRKKRFAGHIIAGYASQVRRSTSLRHTWVLNLLAPVMGAQGWPEQWTVCQRLSGQSHESSCLQAAMCSTLGCHLELHF